MGADEGHLEAVAGDLVRIERRFEVGAADREPAVRLIAFEAACRVQRVDDGDAQPTAGLENARCLSSSPVEIVGVLERHERDDAVERGLGKGQLSGVGEMRFELGVRLACGGEHGG